MSKFLPYREDDGNVYLYEFEENTKYHEGEILLANNVFYRVEKTYTSSSSINDDFDNNFLSMFNKMDMEGVVYTRGPSYAKNGYGYGNVAIYQIAPEGECIVGYNMFGVGAANYPDGGRTGSNIGHYIFTKKLKVD